MRPLMNSIGFVVDSVRARFSGSSKRITVSVVDCWDNAVAENFFATLKTELIYTRRFATRVEA